MKKHKNPLAQKILDAGGTIIETPIPEGEIHPNSKFAQELFDALERPTVGDAIRKHEKKSAGAATEEEH